MLIPIFYFKTDKYSSKIRKILHALSMGEKTQLSNTFPFCTALICIYIRIIFICDTHFSNSHLQSATHLPTKISYIWQNIILSSSPLQTFTKHAEKKDGKDKKNFPYKMSMKYFQSFL